MKKIILLIIVVIATHQAQAQTCYAGVPANAIHLPNDTVIISQNSGQSLSDSYVPCGSLRMDSSITVQNRIYLRPGSSFIADSLSTLYGGFFIYADSGATVDMNFKAAMQLSYTTGTILIDTNNQSSMIFCSVLPFDFSQMTQPHNCTPLATKDIAYLNEMTVANKMSSWQFETPDFSRGMNWELFSIDGQKINTGKTQHSILEVEHAGLVKGIYLMRFFHNGQAKTVKLYKQ